ncbi:MAG: hypothetical protein IIC13_17300 [SAR324 cluster bacterium]|nr:hypothetical protein [SAR324 cluster bacterium]
MATSTVPKLEVSAPRNPLAVCTIPKLEASGDTKPLAAWTVPRLATWDKIKPLETCSVPRLLTCGAAMPLDTCNAAPLPCPDQMMEFTDRAGEPDMPAPSAAKFPCNCVIWEAVSRLHSTNVKSFQLMGGFLSYQ